MQNRRPKHAAQNRKAARNPLFLPLIAVCALVLVLAGLYIYRYYADREDINRLNESLIELLNTAEPSETPPVIAEPPAPTPEPTRQTEPDERTIVISYPTPPSKVSSQFTALYEVNPDLAGYLRIPSTSTPIDLFVVKRDNTFYLDHDFYGNESKAGTLFMDQANSLWPMDQHTIIYGHNMKNGTMFARLTKYKAIEYATRNPFVYFDSIYENITYTVVAALKLPAKETMTDEFNIRTFIFGDASMNAFLYQILNKALYVTNVGVNSSDELLTLVTCSYTADDERFILVTRRLRDGETEEDIRSLIGAI